MFDDFKFMVVRAYKLSGQFGGSGNGTFGFTQGRHRKLQVQTTLFGYFNGLLYGHAIQHTVQNKKGNRRSMPDIPCPFTAPPL